MALRHAISWCLFSNYVNWLRDPLQIKPSAHVVWSIVGQDILNSDVGSYFKGLSITSSLFQVWASHALVTYTSLKLASFTSLMVSVAFLLLSYFVMHISPTSASFSSIFTLRHAVVLCGLASLAWSSHLLHVSAPITDMLASGIDPLSIPSPSAFLSASVFSKVVSSHVPCITFSAFAELLRHPLDSTASLKVDLLICHHFYLGLTLLLTGCILRHPIRSASPSNEKRPVWHYRLAVSLLVLATLAFVMSQSVLYAPSYPYLASDYPTVVCIYTHHMWIGGLLMVGAGSHGSIHLISEYSATSTSRLVTTILSHRDTLLAHLIWVTVFLGFHAFGLYVHNDTLEALGRPYDTFSDTALQLRPVFANVLGLNSAFSQDPLTSVHTFYVYSLGSTVLHLSQLMGTSDFLIHHIHAFTIHTSALILLKGILYSRSSRLVADKFNLGFRYPCDGPGRGGTCQISSWDHIFLALFWMYNTISIVIFHFYWKYQSDIWGKLSSSSTHTGTNLYVSHVSQGDYASNASSINGWLRQFLWTQSSQVIQSYGTSLTSYGVIFLGSHLIWAFSLMFLYSGRGYWQELIESILWSHIKLRFTPFIHPRALSISQGRAVGVSHYILGGVGCSWSFFISRIISLSS